MNTKWLVIATIGIGLGFYQSAWAGDHSEGQHKEGSDTAIEKPDSLDTVWDEIREHQEKLHNTIKEKKLSEVHEAAFALRDQVKLLPEFSKDLSADNQKKLNTWIAGVSASADKLDEYGDAGDQAATEKEAKRVDILIKSIEKLYPAETASYSCPMHPDVVQATPGNCPKCGMALTAKDSD